MLASVDKLPGKQKGYIQELMNLENVKNVEFVNNAMKRMKSGKVVGPDNMPFVK